jgi:hypothetical protein
MNKKKNIGGKRWDGMEWDGKVVTSGFLHWLDDQTVIVAVLAIGGCGWSACSVMDDG